MGAGAVLGGLSRWYRAGTLPQSLPKLPQMWTPGGIVFADHPAPRTAPASKAPAITKKLGSGGSPSASMTFARTFAGVLIPFLEFWYFPVINVIDVPGPASARPTPFLRHTRSVACCTYAASLMRTHATTSPDSRPYAWLTWGCATQLTPRLLFSTQRRQNLWHAY